MFFKDVLIASGLIINLLIDAGSYQIDPLIISKVF